MHMIHPIRDKMAIRNSHKFSKICNDLSFIQLLRQYNLSNDPLNTFWFTNLEKNLKTIQIMNTVK